jgi:hypothetical protein
VVATVEYLVLILFCEFLFQITVNNNAILYEREKMNGNVPVLYE